MKSREKTKKVDSANLSLKLGRYISIYLIGIEYTVRSTLYRLGSCRRPVNNRNQEKSLSYGVFRKHEAKSEPWSV